jgi:hypothetical protein
MKPEIRFTYQVADDYTPTYANGAHGGVSPRGELVIHFYHERPPLPASITHELTAAGTIGRETAQTPAELQATMVRSVEAGVVFSYENACNFHQWLGERLKEMESLEAARAAFTADPLKGDHGATH